MSDTSMFTAGLDLQEWLQSQGEMAHADWREGWGKYSSFWG